MRKSRLFLLSIFLLGANLASSAFVFADGVRKKNRNTSLNMCGSLEPAKKTPRTEIAKRSQKIREEKLENQDDSLWSFIDKMPHGYITEEENLEYLLFTYIWLEKNRSTMPFAQRNIIAKCLITSLDKLVVSEADRAIYEDLQRRFFYMIMPQTPNLGPTECEKEIPEIRI